MGESDKLVSIVYCNKQPALTAVGTIAVTNKSKSSY
jgi:hypothetical protein